MIASLHNTAFMDQAYQAASQPDPLQSVAEWADDQMMLPAWSAEPGQWRTSRTPYLQQIMECLSPLSPVRRVVFMKPAQIGGTSCGLNWIGFMVHRAPTAMLIVEPTVDVAQKLSKQKIQPMLDSVPVLKGRVKEVRSRDSGNTILSKEFLGGMMVLTGANSGVGLRFMSAQYLFLDEVDAYPFDVDGEGTPVGLAEKRALTYARHKIYLCSTPLEKHSSVIEPEYLNSDQRRFYVPCPFCGHAQVLQWKQLKWPPDEPGHAAYECERCLEKIEEHHKTAMLSKGEWRAAFPDRPTAGFHLNALYAPYGWVNSWRYLATEWLRIKKRRDLRELKTFINTNLAESWEDEGEKLDQQSLYDQREHYAAPCPAGVIVLTGAVDVQDDRLECEAIGWGKDEESWSIDYRRFYGSPAQPDVWAELEQWRTQTWQHENGLPMTIIQLVIDTGGHHTKASYDYIKPRERYRVCATKGSSQAGHPLVGRPTKSNLGGVNLYAVGTDAGKDTIFSRLKLTTYGPGYCHHPDYETYDKEFFEQLTSEEKRSKYEKGVLQGTYYVKLRARNEALDLKVLNMAALAILNPNLEALHQQLVAAAEEVKQKKSVPAPQEPQPEIESINLPVKKPPFVGQSRARRAGWASNW